MMVNTTIVMTTRRNTKKKGPVRSKKVVCDGITFASGLEKYMYKALQAANIKSAYEGESYQLLESFIFETTSYERQFGGSYLKNTLKRTYLK